MFKYELGIRKNKIVIILKKNYTHEYLLYIIPYKVILLKKIKRFRNCV